MHMRLRTIVLALLTMVGLARGQVTCADCDGSGAVDVRDALLAAQIETGVLDVSSPSPWACDADGSGRVSTVDVLLMAQLAAGIPATEACGPTDWQRLPERKRRCRTITSLA